MVYEKYIKRRGKIFGPYYYESYRENGQVKTRFISGPTKEDELKRKKRPPRKVQYKKLILILSISFIIFLFFLIGNIVYYKTGKAISEKGLVGLDNIEIAEKIARGELASNMDITEKVDARVWSPKPPFALEVVEFDAPEGKITVSFNLLDYNSLLKKGVEKKIEPLSFDTGLRTWHEKYKWSYIIRLRDLIFFARLDIKSDENIIIINDQTLKIGENYISFADLVDKGYVISMNKPEVLYELPEENISKGSSDYTGGSQDYIKGSSDYTGGSQDYINGSSDYTGGSQDYINGSSDYTGGSNGGASASAPTESSSEPDHGPPPPGSATGRIINSITSLFVNEIGKISGFFVNGFKGIIGFVVQEEQTVSVYILKNLTGISKVGEIFVVDPVFVRFTEFKEPESSIEFPESPEKPQKECIPNWVCEDWNECKLVLNYGSIAEGRTFLKEEQTRVCKDSNKCSNDKIKKRRCEAKIPVTVKKVEKCFKNYTEIYDENKVLISRLELTNEAFKQLNIQLLLSGEHCPYCYDGIKNYDEDETDCVYEQQGSCPVCEEKPAQLRGEYPITAMVLIIIISLFFPLVIWYLFLCKKTKKMEEREKQVKKILRALWKKILSISIRSIFRVKLKKKIRREKIKKKGREGERAISSERKIIREFEIFEKKVQRLKEISRELKSLNTARFEKDANFIKRRLKNVSALPQIEKKLKNLKRKLRK